MSRLADALATVERARPGDRASMRSWIRDLTVEAITERSRLDRKLCAQWDWFATNPNHPDEDAKTDVFLRTLAKYETVCDEIVRARCPSR